LVTTVATQACAGTRRDKKLPSSETNVAERELWICSSVSLRWKPILKESNEFSGFRVFVCSCCGLPKPLGHCCCGLRVIFTACCSRPRPCIRINKYCSHFYSLPAMQISLTVAEILGRQDYQNSSFWQTPATRIADMSICGLSGRKAFLIDESTC
jgi:hypothetical protein